MANLDTAEDRPVGIEKAPTGIDGLDEITGGGLPRGRISLIAGGPGCGKTLLSSEFLVRGADEFGEPGVFFAFEETEDELTKNVASLGFDLQDLMSRGLVSFDHIRLERSEIEETGDFDLEGLFLRLGFAIDAVGAKRVVLDTIEALFSGFPNETVLRAELRRLFRWLKDRGVTTIVTAERGDGPITRFGLEEYVSDFVAILDNRIRSQLSTRRLRIVKYRGSAHGTNEYPFLIGDDGISVLPITSLRLDHEAHTERVSTGISGLDDMLEGKGFFRGTSVLITGTAGTGKTSVAAHIADAACRSGKHCLYLAFEESPQQLKRNMSSIGIDLAQWERAGLLHTESVRSTLQGLELHLVSIHRHVKRHRPAIVILDPISNLLNAGDPLDVESILVRLLDYLKQKGITSVMTNLADGADERDATPVGISSLMDTWILVRMIEAEGERNRGLYVLKSRGMDHSNQIREMRITAQGVQLVPAYMGIEGVLTGAARAAQESRDAIEAMRRRQDAERRGRDLERKRSLMDAQIAALRAQFEAEADETRKLLTEAEARDAVYKDARSTIAGIRRHDHATSSDQ